MHVQYLGIETDPNRCTMPSTLPTIIEQLRKTEVTEPLRRDPRSTPGCPLGLGRAEAVEAIGWGQANFDESFAALSADDRVMLYAYWNQKRHLEELTEAFRQLFSSGRPKDPLIVIDLGCGPFTGGLALAGQLGSGDRFDYIGVDRSQAMRRLGERFASATERIEGAPQIERRWIASISEVDWPLPPGWRPVVVIVSFLLASPSVDVEDLIHTLDNLLAKLSRGDTAVVYTNSPRPNPNRSFPAFRDGLKRAGFRLLADDTGDLETEHRTLEFRYALFHRHQQRTLHLGDD